MHPMGMDRVWSRKLLSNENNPVKEYSLNDIFITQYNATVEYLEYMIHQIMIQKHVINEESQSIQKDV